MMGQQINICKGKTMLKRAKDINEEINELMAEDKIRKEAENNQKLKVKITELSDLLELAKFDRQRYAVDYNKILVKYPETKAYLEALGYTIVYMKENKKYSIAFDEATAKSLESRNKKYLIRKLIVIMILLVLWFGMYGLVSIEPRLAEFGGLVVIPATCFIMFSYWD